MTALRHTRQIALRSIRALLRQPAWIGIQVTQPVIWLLLFGTLFNRAVDIPGFEGGSYIEYLTPGVLAMLSISAAWTGMGLIEDMDRGTLDRLLVSPVWRGALNLGAVAQAVLALAVQSAIVVVLALAAGATFHNGATGILVLIGVAALLGAVFASLSNAIAALTRQRETLIGIVTMATLPLTFLSTALMQERLLPDWIRWAAMVNPVDWAVEAGRSAVAPDADWGLVATRAGLLVALLLASAAWATRALGAYNRSA